MRNSKQPKVNLKAKYKKTLEASLLASLLILSFFFLAFAKNSNETKAPPPLPVIEIEVVTIPKTIHKKKIIKPTRPVMAEEEEIDEDFPEDVTIDIPVFDPFAEIAPPEPDDDDIFKFVNVSEKPELLFQAPVSYPELARNIGVEGNVVVTVTISKKGDVLDAQILTGHEMLQESAIAAAMKCKFKPAKQRDKFVKVRMNIPFKFKLR